MHSEELTHAQRTLKEIESAGNDHQKLNEIVNGLGAEYNSYLDGLGKP